MPEKNKAEYLQKLLEENIAYHNKVVCYRAVLEKHGLIKEAEEMEKTIYSAISDDSHKNEHTTYVE